MPPVSNDIIVADANACIFKELAFSIDNQLIKNEYYDSLQLFFKKCNELAAEICYFGLIAKEAERNAFKAVRILYKEHHICSYDIMRRASRHVAEKLSNLFKNKITQRTMDCTEEQLQEIERFYGENAHCRKHLIGPYAKDITPSEADLKILAGTISLQTQGTRRDRTAVPPHVAS